MAIEPQSRRGRQVGSRPTTVCVEINTCMLSVLSTINWREAAEASLRLPMYVCEGAMCVCVHDTRYNTFGDG